MEQEPIAHIYASSVKGSGLIEGVSLSKILASGDKSTLLFASQLDKPLTNEEIERMLSNQSIVLNSVGNRQLQHSIDIISLSGSVGASERFLKNAFKALELSRKCLTALNEVRNPKRSTFIKQQLNQLNLGEQDAPNVDRIAESKAESFDPAMATLDKIDRC